MSTDTRLFVGNLPPNTNERDLQDLFSCFGNIVNLDLKTKSSDEENKKNFAFVTLSLDYDVDACLKYFMHHAYLGNKLYVTRARESFLERLQRERNQAQDSKSFDYDKNQTIAYNHPVINLSESLNPRKRKVHSIVNEVCVNDDWNHKKTFNKHNPIKPDFPPDDGTSKVYSESNQKKQDSDKKRLESLKKKRQEFEQKKIIIKTGLTTVDKVQNKKIVFSDDEVLETKSKNRHALHADKPLSKNTNTARNIEKTYLFEEDGDSDDNVNFQIKKQFEGKKGQKVLDLQSRFQSDKRFTLDERFIEDETEDELSEDLNDKQNEQVELKTEDEKAKQLNILQDLLGVSIKSKSTYNEENPNKKIKSKLGMLRFDPTQPEHVKYLAAVEEQQELGKKSKKKKNEKKEETTIETHEPEGLKVEVSKEQFYKISETLKEAIAQPTTFSLRSLFNTDEDVKKDELEQDTGYIPLEKPKEQKKKVKNPLDTTGEKNPFVYDSSDSEAETETKPKDLKKEPVQDTVEPKVVWKENLFFSKDDNRFKEGLAFFNKTSVNEGQKERRELKSLMKKRIYNQERKNQMFQKKIGGRKKTMKKNVKNKNR